MNSQRRRVLLVLCGLLLIALYYAWEQSSPQQLAVGTEQRHNISRSDIITVDEGKGIVPLQSYRRDHGAFQVPQKNLFGSAYPSVPAVPSRPATRANRVAEENNKPLPVAALPSPAPPFTVIGHLVRGGEPTVFLASPAGEIHLVKAGTRFAGKALVQQVDTQQIVIAIDNETDPFILALERAENMRFPAQRMGAGSATFTMAEEEPINDDDGVDDDDDDGDDTDDDDDDNTDDNDDDDDDDDDDAEEVK